MFNYFFVFSERKSMIFKLTIFLSVLSVICYASPFDKTIKTPKSSFDYVKSFCSVRPKENFCSPENVRYMFWTRPNEYNKLVEDLKLKSNHWSDSDDTAQVSNQKSKSLQEKQNGKKLVKNIINEFIKLFNA